MQRRTSSRPVGSRPSLSTHHLQAQLDGGLAHLGHRGDALAQRGAGVPALAVLEVDDPDAVLVLLEEGHRVLAGGVHPVGVHLQQKVGAGQQLLLGMRPSWLGLNSWSWLW